MKLISKQINIDTIPIRASWTREMSEDLMIFDKVYEYKFENELEVSIVKKYFKYDCMLNEKSLIYFLMDKKILRKIKLLILNEDELSEIFKKIINNSSWTNRPWIQDLEKDIINALLKEMKVT